MPLCWGGHAHMHGCTQAQREGESQVPGTEKKKIKFCSKNSIQMVTSSVPGIQLGVAGLNFRFFLL